MNLMNPKELSRDQPSRPMLRTLGLVVLGLASFSCEDYRADKAYTHGDYSKTVKELHALAEYGEARAQYDLGLMYDQGQGVPQNNKEAMRWYYLAAEQGEAKAQYNLGLMYANGQGVPQNYSEAYFWVDLAAKQGNEHAIEARSVLAGKMTPEQMAEAKRLGHAREGLVDRNKGCQLCSRPSNSTH